VGGRLDRLCALLAAATPTGDEAAALAEGLEALIAAARPGAAEPGGGWTVTRAPGLGDAALVARSPRGDELSLRVDADGTPFLAVWDNPRDPDAVPVILDVHHAAGGRAARIERGGESRIVPLPARPTDRPWTRRPRFGAWVLVVQSGPRAGLRCPMSERVRVGRVEDNDLTIPEPAVSRHHAVLERAEGGWTLIDLDSANGSWVNGRRVTRQVVTPGDHIRFGDVAVGIEPA
jgi:hypothetical protein